MLWIERRKCAFRRDGCSLARVTAIVWPLVVCTFAGVPPEAVAGKSYAPGITDTEITIGQTMPYGGNVSAWGAIGKAELAYFKMINERGGINGRRINLISLDDGYNPARTIDQTRKLVEQEAVAFIFSSLGTAPNTAIQKYLNDRKVPHLFIISGATKWADPEHFPWTMGLPPIYQNEGRTYARYLLKIKPEAKIAVLYQNDDFGKDLMKGLRDGLGDKAAKLIVSEASYEVTDATVDSQIVSLQSSGADTLFNAAAPKFAAQAIRKAYDIGWRPLQFLNNASTTVSAVLKPAGLEKSVGIMSITVSKDPTDPRWRDDSGFKDWLAWMQTYNSSADIADAYNVLGYNAAMALTQVLKQCGDDLSRENIMRQAANLHGLTLPMLLPGITLNTGPHDYQPIKQMYLRRFNGQSWELLEEATASISKE